MYVCSMYGHVLVLYAYMYVWQLKFSLLLALCEYVYILSWPNY